MGGRGYGVLGLWKRNTCRKKSLYRSIFLDDNILHCLLRVLSFNVVQWRWCSGRSWLKSTRAPRISGSCCDRGVFTFSSRLFLPILGKVCQILEISLIFLSFIFKCCAGSDTSFMTVFGTVLWIRVVYLGSEFFPSRIPDPGVKKCSGSRIRIRNTAWESRPGSGDSGFRFRIFESIKNQEVWMDPNSP